MHWLAAQPYKHSWLHDLDFGLQSLRKVACKWNNMASSKSQIAKEAYAVYEQWHKDWVRKLQLFDQSITWQDWLQKLIGPVYQQMLVRHACTCWSRRKVANLYSSVVGSEQWAWIWLPICGPPRAQLLMTWKTILPKRNMGSSFKTEKIVDGLCIEPSYFLKSGCRVNNKQRRWI